MRIGVQLYAFKRAAVEQDVDGVLGSLREIGYEAVEGLPGHPVVYRARLDELGMRYAASHMGVADIPDTAPLVDYLAAMGGSDVCCSGPIGWREADADGYRRTAEVLNAQGRELRRAGIHVHYHNHEHEFEPLPGGELGMQLLLAERDPEAWDLCFDAGWPWQVGVDPAVFIRDHAAAIGYVHLRDFIGRESTALGRGELDLAAIVAAVKALPALRWLIVEHDPNSDDPVGDLAASRACLRDRFSL